MILKTEKLPHDPFLLAQMALTMETQIRDWPERLPEGWPAMPEELEKQGAMRGDDGKNEKNENNAKNGKNERTEIGELESCKAQGEPRSNTDIAIVPSPSSSDTQEPPSSPSSHTSHPPATPRKPKLTRAQRRLLQKLIPRMETDFLEHRCAEAVAGANELIGAGAEDPEMHLIAGLACEEGGDGPRARMHLVRLIEFEPAQMMARTFLARVYWRNGWNDLAEDLWRSLPIEGPDDYGRHYHLALAHEAAGRRADALRTMLAGLNDFYMETREFYIERAWWRWNRRVGEGGGGGGGGD
ncbi:hypothetical protein HY256_10770 [Candidatus Sumerlaeota bacterium]|nr:hypothetical protein [Candidatus Sumerlaeota bacterium]